MKYYMKRNEIKGFTLVELLAVIVILAIILVIAVPKVMDVINDSKKATLESTVKMIASSAEKTKVQNTVLGKNKTITCESVAKINDVDYTSCNVTFENNTAKVTIIGSGKFAGLNVCQGTKTNAVATNESCSLRILTVELDSGTDNNTNYNTKYEAGSEVILIEPTKEGYIFVGWVVSGTGAIVNGNKLIMGTENTTVTATWDETGATYLKELLAKESTLHNGLIKDDTVDQNIRYAGATSDVKNKVYFNCKETDGTNEYGSDDYDYDLACEIWRIIGVFDTKSGESEIETPVPRIKIVRDEVLSTNRGWAEINLIQYLNDGEGSYYNSLSRIAKEQIDDALWYTGAVEEDSASGVYEDERGDVTGTSTIVNYTTKMVEKIGLIYPSDFGYAGTNCGDYTIYGYTNSCGKIRNWLTISSGTYWTISLHASRRNDGWIVNYGGNASSLYLGNTSAVRPALYLAANVRIIDGDGYEIPYKLK